MVATWEPLADTRKRRRDDEPADVDRPQKAPAARQAAHSADWRARVPAPMPAFVPGARPDDWRARSSATAHGRADSGDRYQRSTAQWSGAGSAATASSSRREHSIRPDPTCDDADGYYITKANDELTARCTATARARIRTGGAHTDVVGRCADTDKVIALLGEGTFGKVLSCHDRERQQRVAVKVIKSIQKVRCRGGSHPALLTP